MTEKNMWMVRCGQNSLYCEEFYEKNIIAIGFDTPDLSKYKKPEEIWELIKNNNKEWSLGKARNVCGQLFTFSLYFKTGDAVVTYDSSSRIYHIGEIKGEYTYNSKLIHDLPHTRKVKWLYQISRDVISTEAKNSLGAIQTVFKVPDKIQKELDLIVLGHKPDKIDDISEISDVQNEDLDDLYNDIHDKAKEFVKDKILQLDWEQMQRLVAGILRGMGYKTRISPKGYDRGRDIVASPDGLGLENPKIVVEVKHRQTNNMSAPDLRSFLGGLRSGDKGLYVSTGGFSKDAKYEADRSNVPITLIDLDELVELLMQHYENVDSDTRSLVPLVKLYWPTK